MQDIILCISMSKYICVSDMRYTNNVHYYYYYYYYYIYIYIYIYIQMGKQIHDKPKDVEINIFQDCFTHCSLMQRLNLWRFHIWFPYIRVLTICILMSPFLVWLPGMWMKTNEHNIHNSMLFYLIINSVIRCYRTHSIHV